MTSVGSASVGITGDVSTFAATTTAQLRTAMAAVHVPPVEINVDVDRVRSGIAPAFTTAGADAAMAMTEGLNNGLSGLSGAVGSNPYVSAAGAALAASLVAVAAPAIGALLSGAVIAVGGLGVIGLGAWLLREEPALREAGSSLMDTLKGTFTEAAQPLLQPLVAALGIFQGLIERIGPDLKAMFAGLGESGAIEALANGLAGLAENALPGFMELVRAAGPFLTALGEALPHLGNGLTVFFSAIADGGPGAALFFQDLIKWLTGAIAGLGLVLGWLSSAYPAVRQFFTDAAAWVADAAVKMAEFGVSVWNAVQPIVPIVTAVWQTITAVTSTAWELISTVVSTATAVVRGVIEGVLAAISGDWQGTWSAIQAVTGAVLGGIQNVISSLVGGIPQIIGSATAAARNLWSVAWSAMITVVTGAAGRISSALNGLKATITGAFSAAGSWLTDAGRRIIDGLISGIRSGFERVRSTLGSLTSMLPDWKGPAEVDRRILEESGRLVMEGFRRGLEGERGSIRRTLQDLTGELPSFTAGPVRGGDGAVVGAPVFNIEINITGQGADAGEEAAETILERLGQAVLVR